MAINDLLRAALSTSVNSADPVLPAPPQVAAPASLDLSGADFYQIAAGQGNQSGAASMGELETDLRTMLPADLYAKYGADASQLILAQAEGNTAFQRDQTLNNRNVSMVAGDVVSGVGAGLGNAIAGIGALGLGLVNDRAGTWASEKIQDANDWVQSTQSDVLNARRRSTQAVSALENRDSQAQFEDERGAIGEVPAAIRQMARDAYSAVSNGLSDDVTFVQGTSDAVGSLLAAGPISKSIKALGAPLVKAVKGIGAEGIAAGRLAASGDTLATTAAISVMEAGGAYQQTAAEVMGRSFEELTKNSPQFRELVAGGMSQEDARSELANSAGQQAAAIQAPIAAATGAVVARFESAPFHVPNIRTALTNALIKEPLEEGIQSGSGGLAQNYAIQQQVDPTQQLSEGVGEQIGQGALYGFSAAGTVQGPGVAVQSGVKAANATMQGLKSVVTPVFSSLVERGSRIIEQNERNSPIADSVVGNAASEAVAQAPMAAEEIRAGIAAQDITPEEMASANSYVDSLMSQLTVDPVELDEVGYSPNIRPLMENASNRVEAMQNLAEFVNRVKEDTAESIEAGYALINMVQSLNDFKMRESTGLDGLDPESRPAQLLNQYAGLLANINTPKISRAIQSVLAKLDAQEDGSVAPQVTDDNIEMQSGKQAVNEALVVAENAPQKLNPDTADQILYQESQGRLVLTPVQRAALNFSKTILSEQRAYNAEVDRLGLKRRQDLVSKQVTTDTMRTGDGEKSALTHYKGIRSAMAAGNTDLASALLADFGEFAQHMQNKVGALNTHFATGNPNADSVPYMALQPDRTWKQSAKGLYVNARSTKSLEQAHQIALEAQVLANVFNGLSESFPELNGGHIGAVSLDSRLDGPIQEVADSFRRNSRVVDSAPTEVVAQPVAEAQVDDTPAASAAVVEESKSSENVVTPESTPDAEVVAEPVIATEPATETVAEAARGIDAVYPNLTQTEKYPNHFKQAFKLPAESRTHTLGAESPISMVQEALSSGQNFIRHVGNGVRHDLTIDVINGYDQLFKEAGFIKKSLNKALQTFLTEKNVGGRFLEGKADANTWLDGKLLNITDNDNGKLTFNDNLVENAILAGLHWLVNTNVYSSEMTPEDFVAYTGLPMDAVGDDIASALNQGMSTAEAKRSLAQKIKSYWGMDSNANAPLGYVEGIPESMAAEIIQAMIDNDLMIVATVELDQRHGLDHKQTFDRYIVAENVVSEGVKDYPNAIEHAVMVDPEEVNFIGDGLKMEVARTQMNNPLVENTEDQQSALREEQKTPYYFNQNMINVYTALGMGGLQRLFGAGNISGQVLNEAHAASLKGKNRTIGAAMQSLAQVYSETRNLADAAGTALTEMPIRYRYNMSRVGRMQMLGKYTPQSSKLVREAILPTRSTLNLNDPEHYGNFIVAAGQHFGVKVHNMSREAAITKIEGMLASMGDAVELMKSLNSGSHVPTEADVDTLLSSFKAAGADMTPAALHSLSEFARIDDSNRGEFTTGLYLEADGMTNGPANAMGLMSVGDFNQKWLDNMQKVGVTFGAPLSANEIRSNIDPKDLYQAATDETAKAVTNLRAELVNDQFGTQQMNRLFTVLDTFFGNDINFDAETETLSLGRGALKNPLTITIYGSGANGIAGNVTQSLIKKIYERLSDVATMQKADSSISMAQALFGVNDPNAQQKMNAFYAAMDELTSVVPMRTKAGIKWDDAPAARVEFADPVEFQFTGEQIKNLQQNMLHLFVAPMRTGITATVGAGMMKAVETLRRATQVQSIFLEDAFKKEVAAALDAKQKADPSFKKTEFLSQAELRGINRKLDSLAPTIDTGAQRFYIAASNSTDINASEFGRGLSSKSRMSTPANIYGPANAGVAGAAFMTIGTGDGRMMQYLANEKLKGTLKVFDGMNIALDERMTDYSRRANEAVYKSWQGNPLADVLKSWQTFEKSASFDDISNTMLADLYRALGIVLPRNEIRTLSAVQEAMAELGMNLEFAANSAADRLTARQSVANSVDQMAAAGVPYSNGVTPSEDPLAALQAAYKAARDKRAGVEVAPKTLPIEVENFGRQHRTGARVLSYTALQNMARSTEMTPAQKIIFGEIQRSQSIKDWKVVVGNAEQIAAYQDATGNIITPMDKLGATVIADKTMYLYNPTVETLIHEQVHAATFEKVLAHYEGNTSPEVSDAIGRIEGLMQQFMEDSSNDPAVVTAQAVITEAQSDLDSTDAVSKAKALNEFMAWALTNEQLTENLKSKQSPSLVQMAKDVIKFLKQLFWGRKKAPFGGDDALSTLQFNTGVIIRSAPTIADGVRDTALFQNQLFGNNDRLTSLQQTFNKKIADYARVRVDPNTGNSRRAELTDALRNSSALTSMVNAHGFPMTMQEAGTFRSLTTAMTMSIELDSNALAKAQELYTHATKTMTVDDFMPENPIDPQAARYYAQEQYNVIMGNYLTTKDAKGRSSLLPVFVALAMTNDQFRSMLNKMSLPKADRADGRTMDGMLENVGQSAMDKLSAYVSGTTKAKNVGAAMDALMSHMYNDMQDTQTYLDQYASKSGGIYDRANQYIVDGVTKLSEAVISKAADAEAKANNKVTRALARAAQITASMATEKRGAAVAEGFIDMANRSKLWTPLYDLFNDLVGRTDNNSNIYDMIKNVRAMVQQDRQQFREHLPGIIAGKFKRDLSKEQWSMLHRGMGKTDLAALGSDALRSISDDAYRAQQIAALEDTIRNESPQNFSLYQTKMQQLANFMMNGEVGHNLLRNAHAISRLYGEKRRGAWKIPQKSVVDAIDQLTSLYAVEQLAPMVRSDLSNLITNESEGMDFALSYLRGQRKDENSKAVSPRAKNNQFKGYIPSMNQPGVSLLVAEDTEFAKLAERSYIRVADYKGSNFERGATKKGYYFAPVSGRAAYNQGIFQNVRHTSNGVDAVTGFSHDNMTAGRITERAEVQAINASMASAKSAPANVEALMPIYDDKGVAVAYERAVDPKQLLRTKGEDHFAQMIGVWRGRQVEEAKAQFFNERLVDALHDMYDADTKASSTAREQYVDLFAKKSDRVISDAADLFSAETRAYIKDKFGEQFWVRKDMLNDAIGYRSASTGDVFTGNTRWSKETTDTAKKLALGMFGNKAYSYITNGERVLQNFVQDARTIIVIKSVVVPISNSIANVYQLAGRGVPLLSIAKGYPQKISEIDSYVKSRLRQIEAEAELRATTDIVRERKLKAEIQSITDSHKRLSIWPLIEAGEFTAISDVGMTIDDIELTSGRLNAYMERLTDKLPESFKTAGRYALITKDTALYQGLQKAIQYGDFVAKAVLYDDLVKRQRKTPEYALGRITEEFVNYDRLPGRFRGYLESIGLLWFWNFKIRSAKVGLSMIRNNPLHSLLAVAAPAPTMFGSVGLPIEDNLFAKMADGSLDYSVGVGQAFRAPLLNPWINLTN